MDTKEKVDLLGNGTSYSHEILHGARGDMYKSYKRFELITFSQTGNISMWIWPKFSVKMADQPSTPGHSKAKEKASIAWNCFIYRALCFTIVFITTIIITIQNGIQNILSWEKSSAVCFFRIQMLIFQVYLRLSTQIFYVVCTYLLQLHAKFHDRMKCRFLKCWFFLWGSIYGPLGTQRVNQFDIYVQFFSIMKKLLDILPRQNASMKPKTVDNRELPL